MLMTTIINDHTSLATTNLKIFFSCTISSDIESISVNFTLFDLSFFQLFSSSLWLNRVQMEI